MNVFDERTRSLWMDAKVVRAPALDGSERADVAVIGAGIAGLSVAYELWIVDSLSSFLIGARSEAG